MVPIYLPEATRTSADTLTPRQIVAELDKYVIGQHAAKRAVAIALRNRMRRQKLSPELAEELIEGATSVAQGRRYLSPAVASVLPTA